MSISREIWLSRSRLNKKLTPRTSGRFANRLFLRFYNLPCARPARCEAGSRGSSFSRVRRFRARPTTLGGAAGSGRGMAPGSPPISTPKAAQKSDMTPGLTIDVFALLGLSLDMKPPWLGW